MEGEVLDVVGSSTEKPPSGSVLAIDKEGSHGEMPLERSPCQGPKLNNTPTTKRDANYILGEYVM